MSITFKQGFTGELSATSDANGFSVSRVAIVENDDKSDDMEMRILTDFQTPKYGDEYSFEYPTLTVSSVVASPYVEDGYKWWLVTVQYTQPSSDGGNVENPLNEPPQISIRSNQYERYTSLAYDKSDDTVPTIPIETNTFEPFSLATIESNMYISMTYNLSSFQANWILDYENTLNSSTTNIAGVGLGLGQARMLRLGAQNKEDANGNTYYTVTAEIEITRSDFIKAVLNKGYKKIDTNGVEETDTLPILNKDVFSDNISDDLKEDQINEAVKLDALGQPITDDSAHYTRWRTMKYENWNSLNLPTSF